jgi:hypothetical protein
MSSGTWMADGLCWTVAGTLVGLGCSAGLLGFLRGLLYKGESPARLRLRFREHDGGIVFAEAPHLSDCTAPRVDLFLTPQLMSKPPQGPGLARTQVGFENRRASRSRTKRIMCQPEVG